MPSGRVRHWAWPASSVTEAGSLNPSAGLDGMSGSLDEAIPCAGNPDTGAVHWAVDQAAQ